MDKPEKIDKAENAQEAIPLGVLMDRASEDVCSMLFNYMNSKGMPPSLFDFVLGAAVLKIKEMKASEYAGKIGGNPDGEHSGSTE